MHVIKFIGCIPFLICFLLMREKLSLYKLIPLVVFVNGFQYHLLFTQYELSKNMDLYTNMVMATYVNYYTSGQPRTAIGNAIVCSAYLVNEYVDSGVVHVIFVQWPLLYLYNTSPMEDKYKCFLK